MDSPRTVETGRGLTVLYRNRHLYSSTDPVGRAEENARKANLTEATLVIVPSPLLGYGLDVLLTRLKPGCRILCIEADQQLMSLSLEHIPERLLRHPLISFIRTESAARAADYLKREKLLNARRALYLPLSAGYTLFPGVYRTIHEAVESEIRQFWQNRMTMIHMGRLWIKNIFTNLPALAEGQDIGICSTGKPIVAAGAGESLEGAIPWIREARREVFLLAADTALPTLTASGLVPDLVIALEAQLANQKDFIGTEAGTTVLACDITSYPGIIRRFQGRTRFFSSEFGETRLLSRLSASGLLPLSIPPIGSVGIAALYFALRMTERPVFITGLDFAYTPGKPHARQAYSHAMHLARASRLNPSPLYRISDLRPFLRVPGKEERSVQTDYVLASYAAHARELIAEHTDRVFDTGAAGMPLGAVRLTEREIIGKIRECSSSGSGSGAGVAGVGDIADRRNRARTFLEAEERRLEAFIEAGRRILSDTAPETGFRLPEDLRQLTAELDYLYMDSPDSYPNPPETPGFLARALTTARFYLERVRGSLDRLTDG